MRLTLITFFFFSSFMGKAQERECWECLAAARNLDAETALERCIQIEKNKQLKTNEKEVISFVIGRILLEKGKPEAALHYLNVSAKSQDSLFRSLSLGLLGDYYLDKNKPDLALDYYSKASDLANNSLYTPYFLNKQGIVFQIQNKHEDFERIGSRLKVNHLNFFNSLNLGERYVKGPSKYDELNRALLDNKLPEGPYGVGLVNGKPAELDLFNLKYRQFEESYANYPSYNMIPPSYDQICEMAWEATLTAIVIKLKEVAFALNTSEKDFHAYLFGENGYDILPEINQAFSSEGIFQKEQLESYIRDQENATDPSDIENWGNIKRTMREQIAMEKYFYLLSLGLNVTTEEARLADERAKKRIQIKLIYFPRYNFPGATFLAPEKELKNYFEQHKADPEYIYRAERSMNYFKVPIAVSSADTLKFLEELKKLKSEFQKTESDSLFVAVHSDFPHAFNSSNHWATSFPVSSERAHDYFTYPDELESEINAAKIGQVVGPYIDNKAFRLAKVIGFNEKLLTVRHILIGSQKGEGSEEEHERERKFAQDLAKKIDASNFDEYVKRYSEDPGSRDKGGVYADFLDYEMVQPFSDYAVNAPIGKIGVVESDFGFHIMEVLERKPAKFPVLAIVEKKLVPDQKIQLAIRNEVGKLHASMNRKMQSLDLDDKKAYFDSIALIYEGLRLIVVDEYHPFMGHFNSQETNDRLMEYAYRTNLKSSQLLTPIEDSTDWIFPFFAAAYSGTDYNLEQVRGFLELNYWNDKQTDSLKLTFGKLNSLEEIAKHANLKVVMEEISIGSEDTDEQRPAGFESLLSEWKPKTGINWYQSFGPLVAYEIVSTKNEIPSADFSVLKTTLQAELKSELSYSIKSNTSLTLKTIYNYPLFRLGLRP